MGEIKSTTHVRFDISGKRRTRPLLSSLCLSVYVHVSYAAYVHVRQGYAHVHGYMSTREGLQQTSLTSLTFPSLWLLP